MTSDPRSDQTRSTPGCWPSDRRPRVGDTAARRRRVTMEDVERFTQITGDENPLHYDSEFAAASPFGEIIVQGGVTSGLLNAVVAQDLPGPGSVFLSVNWQFVAPVRPGDDIEAVVEITRVRHDKPITELATSITRGDGTLVLRGTAACFTVLP